MEETRNFFFWSLFQWYGAPIVMVAISVAYFFCDTRRPAYVQRVVSSAHGLLGSALYVGAMGLFMADPQEHRPSWGVPYALLFLLPLASVVMSFVTFRGNRLIHLLQPINLLAMVWALFIGAMAVTGDWL
jgi:hypothetical protein